MAYVAVCKESELSEGTMGLFRVERKSVLVVWPAGGEIKAYRGRCPHQDVPLETATFDGSTVVCGLHQWTFDASTGACVAPGKCTLKAYPLRVEDGELRVELRPSAPR